MNTEFYTIKTKHMFTQDTLINNYFAYFHSIMNYCIIFWENSRCSNKIFYKKGFYQQLQARGIENHVVKCLKI